MASPLTRIKARRDSISVLSAEEARRLDREALLARQTYLRRLLKDSGFVIEAESQIEMMLFTIQERAGAELAASELAWLLMHLGRDIRMAILRKYAAGERTVKREISQGLWSYVFVPFLRDLGCTFSLDYSTLGLNSAATEELFSIVGIQLHSLLKEDKIIRLAPSEAIQITRKRINLVITFWCEREQPDGSFKLR